jgi:hypothetical protein
MNFMRESLIRNESMMIRSTLSKDVNTELVDMLVATDYYIDFCLKKEVDYNHMRINIPPYFNQAKAYITEMESSNMCEHIYTGDFAYLKDICQTALNGILNKGLTNAFYYMYTQILKANLNFNSLGDTHSRNQQALRELMLDQSIVQIIDMKS